jgi:hypothetical protein
MEAGGTHQRLNPGPAMMFSFDSNPAISSPRCHTRQPFFYGRIPDEFRLD